MKKSHYQFEDGFIRYDISFNEAMQITDRTHMRPPRAGKILSLDGEGNEMTNHLKCTDTHSQYTLKATDKFVKSLKL